MHKALGLAGAIAFLWCAVSSPPAIADDGASPLLGDWSGIIRAGGESKPFGLRFTKQSGTVMYFTLPEGNLIDVGPAHLTPQDYGYKADIFYFHFKYQLNADQTRLQGTLSFDGNDLPFELSRGKLTVAAAADIGGRVASPRWTFKTGGPIWSSPAVAGDSVYFGSADGSVYALDASSGKVLWQFETAGPVYGSPTVDGAAVYVLSDDGYLYKLNRATGDTLWHFDTHGGKVRRAAYDRTSSRAVVAGGMVYVGSANGSLYALDPANGAERWHFEAGDGIRGSPALADGRVFFGSSDGVVYALDAGNGSLEWQYDTTKPVVSTPLVLDGLVYVGSRNANFYAFDAATGRVKWQKFFWTSWVESSARGRDGVIYIGSSDYTRLFALDAKSGQEQWRFNTRGEAWPDPEVTDKLVYTGGVGYAKFPRQAGFYAVARDSGQVVWSYPMPVAAPPTGNGVASSPAAADGSVYFGGLDGVFYAFPAGG